MFYSLCKQCNLYDLNISRRSGVLFILKNIFILFLFCTFVLFVGCTPDLNDSAELISDPQDVPLSDYSEVDRDEPFVECSSCDPDFDAAFSTFPADTVMFTASGLQITWAELFVFLHSAVSDLSDQSALCINRNDEVDANLTLSDSILYNATEEVLSFTVFEYGSNLSGIFLDETELTEFYDYLNNLFDMYGGKNNFEKVIKENSGFFDPAVFEHFLKLEFTVEKIMYDFYGDNASLFPDDRVAEFAAREDYMAAKHILVMHDSDDNDYAKNKIHYFYNMLSEYTGDDFQSYFDSLILEHSDDPGSIISFPHGYLFQPPDMVTAFSEASGLLEIGQISDIIETLHGYHIILRLPIDFDTVPITLASSGISRTLRQLAALDDFDSVLSGWRDSLDLNFTSEYYSIDIASIFKH